MGWGEVHSHAGCDMGNGVRLQSGITMAKAPRSEIIINLFATIDFCVYFHERQRFHTVIHSHLNLSDD